MTKSRTAGKFVAHAIDLLAWIPRIMNSRATHQDILKMSAFLQRQFDVFFLLFIASILSKTNKTDNFCVVCIKCCQAKVESTRTRPKSLPENGVFFGCFGILPERTELLTKFFSIDEVMKIHKRSRFH